MKSHLLLPFIPAVLLVSLLPAALPLAAQQEQSHFAKFHGAWFDIDYPSGWKAAPIGRSLSSTTGSDSARFTSPDGSAEFYVFSPQWNGDPVGIKLDPQREVLVSNRTETASSGKMRGGGYLSHTVAHWYTARAKDHSYERSWVDVEDKSLNVRHVFGIKYKSQAALQKYKAQYTHFRHSLVQYGD